MKIYNTNTVTKLKIGDFLQCMTKVVSIYKSFDVRAPGLENHLNDLEVRVREMYAVYHYSASPELTPELYALDIKRNRALRGLRGTIEYQHFRDEEKVVRAAKMLKNAFRQQGDNLEKQPFQQKTASVESLMIDVSQNPALSSAVETLGLKDWMASLVKINREFDRKFVVMADVQSPRLREKRAQLTNVFEELIQYTESLARVSTEDSEYISIIVKINNLVESYGSSVLGRTAECRKENKTETVM